MKNPPSPASASRDLAFIEPGAALRGDGLQRVGEAAGSSASASAKETARRSAGSRESSGAVSGNPARDARGRLMAFAGVPDRVLEAAGERQPCRSARAPRRSWRRRPASSASRERCRGRDFRLAGESLERRAARRAAAAVEVRHLARRGVVDQPEGVAADAAHVRVERRRASTRRRAPRRPPSRRRAGHRRPTSEAAACGLATMPRVIRLAYDRGWTRLRVLSSRLQGRAASAHRRTERRDQHRYPGLIARCDAQLGGLLGGARAPDRASPRRCRSSRRAPSLSGSRRSAQVLHPVVDRPLDIVESGLFVFIAGSSFSPRQRLRER